jgi:uncharacterized protein YjbI with pentapeptide repeats
MSKVLLDSNRIMVGIVAALMLLPMIGTGIHFWSQRRSSPQRASFAPTPPLSTEQLLQRRECLRCDLTNVNLSGMDLQDVNLSGANLSGANFSNSDLSGANFENTLLREVNFSNSQLANANFSNSDLENANFSDAILRNSILYGAQYESANFNQADLTGVEPLPNHTSSKE